MSSENYDDTCPLTTRLLCCMVLFPPFFSFLFFVVRKLIPLRCVRVRYSERQIERPLYRTDKAMTATRLILIHDSECCSLDRYVAHVKSKIKVRVVLLRAVVSLVFLYFSNCALCNAVGNARVHIVSVLITIARSTNPYECSCWP